MTRYSTETVDMFEGQSLDRPRILPRAGDTLDMFDSQPRAAQEAPAAPEPERFARLIVSRATQRSLL